MSGQRGATAPPERGRASSSPAASRLRSLEARVQSTFVPVPVVQRPMGVWSLAALALRRPGSRRSVSVLSAVLFVAGAGLFAYPVGTDVSAWITQQRLGRTFGDAGMQASYRTHTVAVGAALTRLRVPRIGLNALVVQGTSPSALRAGAGHYVGSPLPGESGNVAIAGHRTTYGRPFNRLDELEPGDEAVLDTPIATYIYRVVAPFDGHANPWVVRPSDVSVLDRTAGHELTFTTCNPKGSAAQRLVLRLELTATRPQASPGA
jgi:sortase A